tara:strand:- start:343 stop:714 length:372 start_codon:yes stop_codon:yes gene_type:complete
MTQPNPEEYADFDFGFTAADEDELNSLMGAGATEDATSEEIAEMKDKLDLILQMNSTCDGANQVKEQYDELMTAKMHEIEQVMLPLLVNLKKNKAKDYLFWPGTQRETQCELQIQKLLNITRN